MHRVKANQPPDFVQYGLSRVKWVMIPGIDHLELKVQKGDFVIFVVFFKHHIVRNVTHLTRDPQKKPITNVCILRNTIGYSIKQ